MIGTSMSSDHNILNSIRAICANGESGRLEILAGAIQGELSFADGKLIDARFGHLTGFRAVNAAAALRDARFSFDPSFTPLASSSITASERVVLKQFFGIETAATSEYFGPMAVSSPKPVVPIAPVTEADDEVTIVRSARTNTEALSPLPHASRSPYRMAFAFAALAIAVMAVAAILIFRSREPRSPAVAARVESPSRPAPVTEEQKSLNTAQDLSGKWNIINTVETTSYSSFKNLRIGFDVSIDQNGTSFTGKGHKVSENGRSLPVNSRTPIQVEGSIRGDTIEATFFEEGAARKTNGRFVWRIDKAGRGLTGTFAATAARSSGRSAATRVL